MIVVCKSDKKREETDKKIKAICPLDAAKTSRRTGWEGDAEHAAELNKQIVLTVDQAKDAGEWSVSVSTKSSEMN